MNDEEKLIERLRLIETLFARPGTEGEKLAAEAAIERIRARLEETARTDPPVEYRFSLPDPWTRKLFAALARRYGLRPYRYRRQRQSTLMVRASRSFVDRTLWPEFEELSSALREHLREVTDRVIATAIHADRAEADVVDEPQQLAAPNRHDSR